MKKNYYSQRVTAPTAFVTKGRQRVKQYNDNIVYLKNGDEFEIELFNPTTNKVLAKIKLNGKSLGSGLILRPGERITLERYFDEARKFLFETYEIDANDSNAKKAIENNGSVEIEFYAEYIPVSTYHYHHHHNDLVINPSIIWVYHTHSGGYVQPTYTSPTYTYFDSTGGLSTFNSLSYSSLNSDSNFKIGNASPDSTFTCSCNTLSYASGASMPEFKETGRVEKGSVSNQKFTYDNTEFNNWWTWKTTWKILPKSQKPLVKEDLSVYCVKCGAKRKKSTHIFCPTCGEKFS